jgi:hypothetical protein
MANYTVRKRKKASGGTRYSTVVRLKKGGKIIYSESRTFDKQAVQRLGVKAGYGIGGADWGAWRHSLRLC